MLAKRCQTPGTGDTNLPHLPALQWKSFCGYHTQALLTGIQIQNKLEGWGWETTMEDSWGQAQTAIFDNILQVQVHR